MSNLRKQLMLLNASTCSEGMPDDCGIFGDCPKRQTDQAIELVREYISDIMDQWDDSHWPIRHELLEGLDAEGK